MRRARPLLRVIGPVVARCAVYSIYLSVIAIAHCMNAVRGLFAGGRRSRGARDDTGVNDRRLILLGTFYNLGWFRSHILPLAHSTALDEIIVISDEPLLDAPKVTYWKPPAWLRRFGRTPARFIWSLWIARKRRPGIWMGYHVMPNALFALVGARIYGARAIYQMTGGPIQLLGGGHGSENVLLRQLGRPSRWLESLLFHLIRQFDCVVVRGGRARDFVNAHNLCDRCEIITGSVDVDRFSPDSSESLHDLAYVSRLVPCKGLETFLAVVAAVAKERPTVKAVIVGGGPLRGSLHDQCVFLGIEDRVDFLGQVDEVEAVLRRSRLFVLVSPSEGMSIAMLEAMATGLPAVVTDVGDLRDMVEAGRNGVLLDPREGARSTDPDSAAKEIVRLLAGDTLRKRMSEAARSTVVNRCSVDAVARQWDAFFGNDDGNEERSGNASERPTCELSSAS